MHNKYIQLDSRHHCKYNKKKKIKQFTINNLLLYTFFPDSISNYKVQI